MDDEVHDDNKDENDEVDDAILMMKAAMNGNVNDARAIRLGMATMSTHDGDDGEYAVAMATRTFMMMAMMTNIA
eukprot:7246571-Lingulodinium_polyedra.AAC.1